MKPRKVIRKREIEMDVWNNRKIYLKQKVMNVHNVMCIIRQVCRQVGLQVTRVKGAKHIQDVQIERESQQTEKDSVQSYKASTIIKSRVVLQAIFQSVRLSNHNLRSQRLYKLGHWNGLRKMFYRKMPTEGDKERKIRRHAQSDITTDRIIKSLRDGTDVMKVEVYLHTLKQEKGRKVENMSRRLQLFKMFKSTRNSMASVPFHKNNLTQSPNPIKKSYSLSLHSF